MKGIQILITVMLVLMCIGCAKEEEPIIEETPVENFRLSEAQQYYLEIALGTEFGNSTDRIKKWGADLRIFVSHEGEDELIEEFGKIIEDINSMSQSIKLFQVDRLALANAVVFLSDAATYAAYEPSAASIVESNWGAFWLMWNSGCMIDRGSMYVDITRVQELDCRKHLLREELTQMLGLMNDADSYDDSIFYQPWTCGPAYSDIDRELIEIHLDRRIEAGMTSSDVVKVFRDF